MNKTIKVKQLVSIMPESARIRFCICNSNGDTIYLTDLVHVGDEKLYSTYLEKHVHFIEVFGCVLKLFI